MFLHHGVHGYMIHRMHQDFFCVVCHLHPSDFFLMYSDADAHKDIDILGPIAVYKYDIFIFNIIYVYIYIYLFIS